MPKISLIIPAYLKVKTPEEITDAEGILLLRRAIESLNIIEGNELTVVTVFCVDTPIWKDEFDAVLREILNGFSTKFPIVVFTKKNLRSLKEYLEGKDHSEIANKLEVCGYPNIRNCGLIVANLLGTDVSIFIDNDEVIEDKNFLKTTCEYLGTKYKGMHVDGKGGFYLSPEGKLIEKSPFHWWQVFWNKGRLILKTMEKLLVSQERLVESPIILGGNLVLHKNLYSKVPFDPLIPRGEDIDYLINSKRLGFNILFDKELKIRHLHPQRTIGFQKSELKGDIERFLYEREKVKGVNISLDPYPGYFLKNTLPLKAILTIQLLTIYLFLRFRIKDAVEVKGYKNFLPLKWNNVWQEYLKFQKDWERLMDFISKNKDDMISLLR